ncbi:MAG: hypothetical protein AAGE85_02525 [Pseudomonadota bacterium]
MLNNRVSPLGIASAALALLLGPLDAIEAGSFDLLDTDPIHSQRLDVLEEIEAGNYDLFDAACLDDRNEVTCGTKVRGHALVVAVLGKQYQEIDKFGSREDFMYAGSDALYVSAALGDLEAVKTLLEKGREVEAVIESSVTVSNLSDLRKHPGGGAAEYGHLHVIDYLLGVGQLDINMQITEYYDLFVLAVVNGKEATAMGLLDRGYVYDCGYRFPKGKTLRTLASEHGADALVQRIDAMCR